MTAASCNLLGGGAGNRGVFKSQDGAETFHPANQLEGDENIGNINVNILTMDPVDSNILYIGSGDGIYKTTDAAATWKHLLTGMRVGDVAVDPSKNDLIYAAGISTNNGRIIKSTDGGESWKDIYVEPTKNNPVLSLAISRANSRVILAGLNNGEIIRSVDEGITWQIVRDLSNPVTELEYIDSTSAYALTLNNGIYTTSDQGSNWSTIVASRTDGIQGNRPILSTSYYDVAFDPRLKGVIFLATDQGLLRSVDNGANWTLMNLPVTDQTLPASAVAINPTNSNNLLIAVGTTILKTNNGGMTWETRKLPTQQNVRHILFSPQEPNIIYLGMGTR